MLTDDELTTLLREAYDGATAELAPSAGLASAVRGRHDRARRRRAAATIAAPVAALAAVGGVAVWGGPGSPGSSPAPQAGPQSPAHRSPEPAADPGTIRLAGYTFTLPAAFHAEEGICTVTLPTAVFPGGGTHPGTPGADGGCVAVYVTPTQPGWVPGAMGPCSEGGFGPGVPVDPDSTNLEHHAGYVGAFTRSIPASRGGGYVVVAVEAPGSAPPSSSASFRAMVDKALAPTACRPDPPAGRSH